MIFKDENNTYFNEWFGIVTAKLKDEYITIEYIADGGVRPLVLTYRDKNLAHKEYFEVLHAKKELQNKNN